MFCISDESKVLGKIWKKWLREVRLLIRLLLNQDEQDKRKIVKIEISLQTFFLCFLFRNLNLEKCSLICSVDSFDISSLH